MNAFRTLLDDLGITKGDVLYVHSSFSRLKRFGISAEELLDILLEWVGPEGTIAMPSFAWNVVPKMRPWAGYAQFLQTRPCFDVRKTPCNIGWLAESFRLRGGVLRSQHGIWAICAAGPMAAELTTGQEQLESPYGPGSSFWRLVESNAKLIGLGVTLNTSSLCPVADWELGGAHTQRVFTTAPVPVEIIAQNGVPLTTSTQTMTPEAVRSMNPGKVFEISPKLHSTLTFIDMRGDFFFSYPSQTYHQEALRLGNLAIGQGLPMPWLGGLPLREKTHP